MVVCGMSSVKRLYNSCNCPICSRRLNRSNVFKNLDGYLAEVFVCRNCLNHYIKTKEGFSRI